MKVNAPDLNLQPPAPSGRALPMALSLLAHGLLAIALAWGVKWSRTDPMVAFSAEVWAPTAVEAAPAPAAPHEPTPAPPPTPEPMPPKKAEVPTPPPSPPVPSARELAQQREAEIALEKRRKEEARKKLEQEQAKKDKQERDKAEKAKLEKEKIRKAEKEKAERDLAERQKLDKQKAEKARRDEERRDADMRAQMRRDELRRQQQQQQSTAAAPSSTAGTGSAESKGSAARSAAPSSSYAGLIVRQIRENTKYTNPGSEQPTAVVMVKTDPSGKIRDTKVITSSGNRLFDEAVLRGIEKMGTVPKDVDGKIPDVLLREGLEIKVTL